MELSAFLRFARRLAGGQLRNDERFEEQVMAEDPATLHATLRARTRPEHPRAPPNTPEHPRASPHSRPHVPSQVMTHLHLSGYRLLLAKYILLRASQTLDARPTEEVEEQAALPPHPKPRPNPRPPTSPAPSTRPPWPLWPPRSIWHMNAMKRHIWRPAINWGPPAGLSQNVFFDTNTHMRAILKN